MELEYMTKEALVGEVCGSFAETIGSGNDVESERLYYLLYNLLIPLFPEDVTPDQISNSLRDNSFLNELVQYI